MSTGILTPMWKTKGSKGDKKGQGGICGDKKGLPAVVNCKLAADIQRPKGLPDGNDQAYAANSCELAQGFFICGRGGTGRHASLRNLWP